mgnify:CR=1 FL=1
MSIFSLFAFVWPASIQAFLSALRDSFVFFRRLSVNARSYQALGMDGCKSTIFKLADSFEGKSPASSNARAAAAMERGVVWSLFSNSEARRWLSLVLFKA